MKKLSFTVEGMVCDGCRKNVEERLANIEGVKSAKVILKKKRATVEGEDAALAPDVINGAFVGTNFKAEF